MSSNTPGDDPQGFKPFNLNMELPTTLTSDRGGFVPASATGKPVQVKRSTFLVRMPMRMSRGILVKRLATIILPRHKDIAILPHTSSTHDKITDHEAVPTDDMGIGHFIFDEKITLRNRGNRNEFKMFECKIQIESPISLYQIKGAKQVMDLLIKHEIFITAKSYCPAVSTKEIGILMNLDARRCAKNRIIAHLKADVDIETDRDVFMDLVPHRGLVRLGKQVIFGQFLKIMVDVQYATVAAKMIREGLIAEAYGIGLKNVRLMPVYPIPNFMPPEVFGKMIVAHNDSMYGIAEIQVDNVWDIDTPSILPDSIKVKFNLAHGPNHVNDTYTLRNLIMPIFWGQFDNTPAVRDVYLIRGRLMIVCDKTHVAVATQLVDTLFEFLKQEFDIAWEGLNRSADKFAAWVGCSTPKNEHRHPARSGTLVFGEAGVLKATVNSFFDGKLDSLPAGLVPGAGDVARKPDLTRPPPPSVATRGRMRPHVDPVEFTPVAVNAWASANTWASVARAPKRKNQPKRRQVPDKAVIELDNATNSTVSMSSGTQAALEAMRKSVQTLEADRKGNDEKIATLDNTMAQIARDVTALSEAQRKSNTEYIQIKEQILNIAKDSGDMKKEMMEMKDMIMSIAQHLGGVRNDQAQHGSQSATSQQQQSQQSMPSQQSLLTQQQQSQQSTHSQQSTLQQAVANFEGNDVTMSSEEKQASEDTTIDESRSKKPKQTHAKVFDINIPGVTTQRANSPILLHNVVDLSNGSDGNLSNSDEDQASMYD